MKTNSFVSIYSNLLSLIKSKGMHFVAFHEDYVGMPAKILSLSILGEKRGTLTIQTIPYGNEEPKTLVAFFNITISTIKTCFTKLTITLRTEDGKQLCLVAMPLNNEA